MDLPDLLPTLNQNIFFTIVNEMRPLNPGRLTVLVEYTRRHVQANRCSNQNAEIWLNEAQEIYKREQKLLYYKSVCFGILTGACVTLFLIKYGKN